MPTRKPHTATHPEVTPTDPLADLRAEPAAPIALDATTRVPTSAERTTLTWVGDTSQGQPWHDTAAVRAVDAWHRDDTAMRTLHRGGNCPCLYLARTCLRTAVGVTPDPVEDSADG